MRMLAAWFLEPVRRPQTPGVGLSNRVMLPPLRPFSGLCGSDGCPAEQRRHRTFSQPIN